MRRKRDNRSGVAYLSLGGCWKLETGKCAADLLIPNEIKMLEVCQQTGAPPLLLVLVCIVHRKKVGVVFHHASRFRVTRFLAHYELK